MVKNRDSVRILMVEDTADDATLVRLALEEAGYRPALTRVANRRDMAASLAAREWDAILCDHNLPGFDALHALDMVRGTGLATPFIVLSGAIPDELAIEAMRRGARDFIRKDQLGRLAPVLERELTTADLARALNRLGGDVVRLADFDRLTGLPNREHLLRHLSLLAGEPTAQRDGVGLLLVDVNRFRQISHSLERAQADQVIVEIAQRIVATVAPGDLVARVGGDVFAVVARGAVDPASARALAQSLVRQVGQPLPVDGVELFISLCIGAACCPGGDPGLDLLYARGEAALDQAKQAGGGHCRVFQPEMGLADRRAIAIQGALHRALANQEFVLHYQPQVDLKSGRVVSAEALLRWNHPQEGLISPLDFIPLLEQTGLIVPVGAWVIETACRQLHHWQARSGAPMRVAVNLSALQFADPALPDTVATALRRNGIAPGQLELEITESVVMEGRDEAIAALRALRRLGVRIAVDDFGTGYSSLSYLKRFPITTLKIDRLFVHESHNSDRDQALVEAIIAMGHRLGLEIIAEGVESERHRDFLAAHGCDLAQGYYFGRPVTAESLGAQLARAPAEINATPSMATPPAADALDWIEPEGRLESPRDFIAIQLSI